MNAYINAGRLIEQLDKKIPPRTGGNENYVRGFKDALLVFKSMIHSAMTADEWEVVRCKDCVHFCPYKVVEDFDGRCTARGGEADKDDFCNYGAKRG